MFSNKKMPEVDEKRRGFFRSTIAVTGSALLAKGGTAIAKDPKPPYTTPFVMPLPVYRAKQPVEELQPAPSFLANADECGRDSHQGWEELEPHKFYELEVRERDHIFHPELPKQKIWGYDGITSGPTFVARYGEPVVVRVSNKLDHDIEGYGSPEISTHLHNAHCASESDGYIGNYYSDKKYGPTLTRPRKIL